MTAALNIAVVDNNCLVAEMLAEKIRANPDAAMAVVCPVATVDEMMRARQFDGVQVDVVVLDFFLGDGTQAIDNVDRVITAGLPLLLISSEPEHPEVIRLLRRRTVNFLSTTDLSRELVDAVRGTATGSVVMKQTTMAKVRAGEKSLGPSLTPREEVVFQLWASTAMQIKKLASRLSLNEKTVRDHQGNITAKFEAMGIPFETAIDRYHAAVAYGYVAPDRMAR